MVLTTQSEEVLARLKKLDDEEEAKYCLRKFRKIFIPIEETAHKLGKPSKAKQADFLKDKSKIVALICANRSGKTQAGAVKFIDTCLEYPKDESWVLTETHELQRASVQPKILEYLKPEDIKTYVNGLKAIKYLDRYTISIIELKNGHRIVFKSYEQGRERLQAAKLRQAWFDEEPPEDVFDEVLTRTTDLGGQVLLTFTPLLGMTWSYKEILKKADGKWISVYNWGMIDNPYIPETEIEFLKGKLSPRMALARLEGKHAAVGKIVFDPWDRDIHVKPLKYELDLQTDVTVDWGVDVTSITLHQHDPHAVIDDKKTKEKKLIEHFYMIKYIELKGAGYPEVMRRIQTLPYIITDYFCDPTQRGRSQVSKTGTSLLKIIEDEYKIKFKYTKNVGLEESIEIFNSFLMNAQGEARYFVADTETLFMERIENYKRDDDTLEPVKDGINDHAADNARYYLINKIKHRYRKWRTT